MRRNSIGKRLWPVTAGLVRLNEIETELNSFELHYTVSNESRVQCQNKRERECVNKRKRCLWMSVEHLGCQKCGHTRHWTRRFNPFQSNASCWNRSSCPFMSIQVSLNKANSKMTIDNAAQLNKWSRLHRGECLNPVRLTDPATYV